MKRAIGLVAITLGVAACGSEPAQEEAVNESQSAISGSVDLIAIGGINGNVSDLSTETAGILENGVKGNLLGGIGSGLAYAGGTTFLALPDRGPNAVPYNSAVDDTASYINRFHTINMVLSPSLPGMQYPFMLRPTLVKTTLLSSATPLVYGTGAAAGLGSGAPALNAVHQTNYFTGRSDNFDPARNSTDPSDGRLDPESIRASSDGAHVYISDEYGPYVYEFDRATGQRTRSFALPPEFGVTKLSSQGAVEISGNVQGRVANKGMEGLALTTDGKTLVGAMQSPLIQDGGTSGQFIRLITIDIESGATQQFAYGLTNIGTPASPKYPTVSDIVAINTHEFLVDERDSKGLGDDSKAAYKKIYHIDLANAAPVDGLSGEANLGKNAVSKTLFLDVVDVLVRHGFATTNINAKLEGLAFGPDVVIDGVTNHTLFIANDNDFIGSVVDTGHPAGFENANRFYVFAFQP